MTTIRPWRAEAKAEAEAEAGPQVAGRAEGKPWWMTFPHRKGCVPCRKKAMTQIQMTAQVAALKASIVGNFFQDTIYGRPICFGLISPLPKRNESTRKPISFHIQTETVSN